jgi:hypothetical protein
MTTHLRLLAVPLVAIAALVGAGAAVQKPLVRYTAQAVDLTTPDHINAGPIDLSVSRWSTDAERDRLIDALLTEGQPHLLDLLSEMPRAGLIRTPTALGYEIHFARHTTEPDGGERVVLITDRPIGGYEAAVRPRSIDYPFTTVELQLNAKGEGEGQLSLATRITANKVTKVITLERYGEQPVMLKSVKREGK